MDNKIQIPIELTTKPYNTIQYNKTQKISYDTIKHNISYNWPAFVAVNSVYRSSYTLIRIYYQGSHSIAMHTILF